MGQGPGTGVRLADQRRPRFIGTVLGTVDIVSLATVFLYAHKALKALNEPPVLHLFADTSE